MSRSFPDLTELPTEILEQILLSLPAQDVIKMEAVRGAIVNIRQVFVDFVWYDLGEPTLQEPHLRPSRPSA